jgi:hypothetical protein
MINQNMLKKLDYLSYLDILAHKIKGLLHNSYYKVMHQICNLKVGFFYERDMESNASIE